MIPILLDTDIGGDVDDALAIALALRSPEIQIRGITTVRGKTSWRADEVREVLRHFSPDLLETLPIVPGLSGKYAEIRLQTEPEGVEAVHFLAQQILAGERLTLVEIGSLTNVGLMLEVYPETAGQFDLVLMGGYWGPEANKAEWNFVCDPEAAEFVFRAGLNPRMVGLDVTKHVALTREEEEGYHALEAGPRTRYLSSLMRRWGRAVVLHDPLTIMTLFHPCVSYEPVRLEIPLEGDLRARTIRVEGPPNVLAASAVDVAAAKTLFLERVPAGHS
jgi:purine nucleosidase